MRRGLPRFLSLLRLAALLNSGLLSRSRFTSGLCRARRRLRRTVLRLRSAFLWLRGAFLWLRGTGRRIGANHIRGACALGRYHTRSGEFAGARRGRNGRMTLVLARAQSWIAARTRFLLALRRHGGDVLLVRRRQFG